MLGGSGSIFSSGIDLHYLTSPLEDRRISAKNMADAVRSVLFVTEIHCTCQVEPDEKMLPGPKATPHLWVVYGPTLGGGHQLTPSSPLIFTALNNKLKIEKFQVLLIFTVPMCSCMHLQGVYQYSGVIPQANSCCCQWSSNRSGSCHPAPLWCCLCQWQGLLLLSLCQIVPDAWVLLVLYLSTHHGNGSSKCCSVYRSSTWSKPDQLYLFVSTASYLLL